MTRGLLLAFLLASFITSADAASVNLGPDLGQLKFVTQLTSEVPRRVSSIAYDGEKLWVGIYMGQGIYATLDPSSLQWTIGNEKKSRDAITDVSGSFYSPGGLCFINGKLWIGGSYGDSFGSVDPHDWKVENKFSVRQIADSRQHSVWRCGSFHLTRRRAGPKAVRSSCTEGTTAPSNQPESGARLSAVPHVQKSGP